MSEQPRKPAGSPNSTGGEYDFKTGAQDLPDTSLLAAASEQMRVHAISEHVHAKSAEETRGLLAETARVDITDEGAVLYDKDDNLIFRETSLTAHLDYATMRGDPHVKQAVRQIMRAPLDPALSSTDKRTLARNAFRLASPYERRVAIDRSPNRRYIPADSITRSLSRRADQDQAADILAALHYEDANLSAAVIRNGWPDSKHAAFAFINKTMFERYDKDVTDRKTKQVIHRKGDLKYGTYQDKDGKMHGSDEHPVRIPAKKGANARAWLRMRFQPTKGVPDARDTDAAVRVFERLRREPAQIQAQAFADLCYGRDPNRTTPGMDEAISRLNRQKTMRHGLALIDQWSNHEGGQGNAARMIAYKKPMTREAAVMFLAMQPGDQRDVHTGFTSRKRVDGVMRDVTPKRLTEMRSWIHGVYQIQSSEVNEMRERMHAPDEF